MGSMRQLVFDKCQEVFPGWRGMAMDEFEFADPKGFSTFTMGVRARRDATPGAVLYRHLEVKENAILDFPSEKEVFLALGHENIAAHCHHYDDECRIEEFYHGSTLTASEVFESETLRKIAGELYRFHQLTPSNLPTKTFFELLYDKWGGQAEFVLVDQRHRFSAEEQAMCEGLAAIFSEETLAKVQRCLPDSRPVFCHNDTYHGNVMRLDSGDIKLLDFEFSCLNHKAFDFSNLFAETVMQHNLEEPPHFSIGEPQFGDHEISVLIGHYLDNACFESEGQREGELATLLDETKSMIMMSDYMYAMAALPLALEPIQKIRFIPYASLRFAKFLRAYEERFA